MKTCAFTGHRPQNLPFGFSESDILCTKLKDKLQGLVIDKIENDGIINFMTGMALGTDLFAAEIVIKLHKLYPYLTLGAVIPCENQCDRWSAEQQNRYYDILKQCTYKKVLQKEYTPDCMPKRNKFMIDNADCLIAVWDGKMSGTGQTVQLAKDKGIPITVLNPRTIQVSYIV